MRADRLLSILLTLQVHQRVTARELAERLEVSERTIYRDMEALSSAGIPVLAERGSSGGWALLDDYRTDLTGLNPAEIQTLFLSAAPRLLDDLGMRQAYEAALIKLLAALPSISRRDAEYARQRIHIDPAGWFEAPENAAALPVIQDAVWQSRKLRLDYHRGDGQNVERVVDPLGLVAKGSVWYLVALIEGDIRAYRVSRVREAAILDERAARPADFDLAAYWEQSKVELKQNLPRYQAVMRMTPAALKKLRGARYVRVEQESPPDADGWLCVRADFEIEDLARDHALRGLPEIEVLEPPALRAQVIAILERARRVYRP
jgi:predicted DNA-binding transcriptional regulator YafY